MQKANGRPPVLNVRRKKKAPDEALFCSSPRVDMERLLDDHPEKGVDHKSDLQGERAREDVYDKSHVYIVS